MDPRAPVIVGVGQVSQRVPPAQARSPIDLLAEAARAAEADAGAARSLLAAVDVVTVVQIGSWPYPDPGAHLARRLGIEPRRTCVTTTGGNSPQLACNEMAARIVRGECDVVLLGGAEAVHSRWRARRDPPVELTWDSGDDDPCAERIGDDRPGSSEFEIAHQALLPTNVYPMFETALRASAGHGVEEHQLRVSELWAHFADVATANPHAWSRVPVDAETIRTVGPDNRMICSPYPKRMCSNVDVDQGAAVLLCAYEAARAAGVPDDRLVFLHAGADAHDHWFFTERASLADSPGIRAVASAALDAAGIGVDDVARFDLYSCFPSAVQIALAAIGLRGPLAGDDRPLTVTGGLAFAGGPLNNYVTHSIARMTEVLRSDPGSYGMTTALGWYVTKHSAGVWSTRPPARGFVRVPTAATQAVVDAQPRRTPSGPYTGSVRLEASTVLHDRDGGPTLGIVTGLTDDGRRVLANVRDAGALPALASEAWEGRTVAVVDDGTTNTVQL